jgi:hypothetical protein
MTTRTLLWRGLDEPRMEIVYADGLGQAHGTQIGISYELRWRLDGPVLDLEVVGGHSARVELGDADFFDLQHSAFFNSLPAVRDGLIDGGPARDYTMRLPAAVHAAGEPDRALQFRRIRGRHQLRRRRLRGPLPGLSRADRLRPGQHEAARERVEKSNHS